MILYLIKFVGCLGILLLIYHVLLEREKMHQFNRFYLLGSVLFSLAVPSYIIYTEPSPSTVLEATIPITTSISTESSIDWQFICLLVYSIISLLFLARFIKNILAIVHKIRVSPRKKVEHATLVLVDDPILPHTFLQYIFVQKEAYDQGAIEEELLTHELAHVLQKHTVDILLIEFLKVFLWINPLLFFLKKAIQLNHEFLADDHVLTSYNNIPRYQYLLLDKAAWNNTYYLASNLNYSLTKKRLKMMKTNYSTTSQWIKKAILIPICAGLVFVFASRVEAQTTKEIKVVEVTDPITKAEMNEYKTELGKLDKKMRVSYLTVKRLRYLYHKMSSEQKQSVKDINELIPPAPPKPPKPAKRVKQIRVKETKPNRVTLQEVRDKKTKAVKSPKSPKVVEVEETPKVIEIVEVPKGEYKHVNVKEETKYAAFQSIADDIDALAKKGAQFYIDNNKVSAKKAKKILSQKGPKGIKSVDISKNDNAKPVVKIQTQ